MVPSSAEFEFANHPGPADTSIPNACTSFHNNAVTLLHQAFVSFKDVTADPMWERQKDKLQQWQTQTQSSGLYGHNVISLLAAHKAVIDWENMSTEAYTQFYRFLFYVIRDANKRNLRVETALQAWQLVMRGRFRLLDKWCEFVLHTQRRVITEDTWRQVWDFSRTVHEDLSNYDPSGAWAVMLDEFVDHMRQQFPTARLPSLDSNASDFLDKFCNISCMMAVIPRCGSKRRHVDLDSVTSKLSHMPMVSDEEESPSPPCSAVKRTRTPIRPGGHPLSPVQALAFQGAGAASTHAAPLSINGMSTSPSPLPGFSSPQLGMVVESPEPCPDVSMHSRGLRYGTASPPHTTAAPDHSCRGNEQPQPWSPRSSMHGRSRFLEAQQQGMHFTAMQDAMLQMGPQLEAPMFQGHPGMAYTARLPVWRPGHPAVTELMQQTVVDALFQSPSRHF